MKKIKTNLTAFGNCYMTIEKFEPSEMHMWLLAYKPACTDFSSDSNSSNDTSFTSFVQ